MSSDPRRPSILRFIEPPSSRRLRAELAAAERRLTAAEREAARWKARAERLAVKDAARQQLKATLKATKDDLRTTTRAGRSLRRRLPSPDVLRQVMPLRHRALVASEPLRCAAHAREAAFEQVSERYAETRARLRSGNIALSGPFENGGMQWWLPSERDSQISIGSRVARGWLPFRHILNTRELAAGTIMVDLGANIGTTSLPRVVLGDFQWIYAAEPMPANYAALVQNVLANGLGGFVLPDCVAIGPVDGTTQMVRAVRMGDHRLAGPDVRLKSSEDVVPVACRTLDSWLESMKVDLDLVGFVKVDVQGWEPAVLLGATRLLQRRHTVWQMEISPGLLVAAGYSLQTLCDLLATSFTHFIDVGRLATGPRIRETRDLAPALGYLSETDLNHTDLLLYNGTDGNGEKG